jgi:hypothetical protein
MGQIRNQAIGNIPLNEYSRLIQVQIDKEISE